MSPPWSGDQSRSQRNREEIPSPDTQVQWDPGTCSNHSLHLFPRAEWTRQGVAAVGIKVRAVHALDVSSRWRPQEPLMAGR